MNTTLDCHGSSSLKLTFILYGKPVTWDEFNDAVDTVITSLDCDPGCPLTDDEAIKLDHDGIRAKLASINTSYEPRLFSAVIAERAHMSHVSLTAGSVSIDASACDIFEANLSAHWWILRLL